MRVTFLGTGAAGGVPRYGCDCPACRRAARDVAYQRRPCSALVEHGNTRILIDASLMDLHERFAPSFLSAIVLTHYHPDHVQGLFHLRWGSNVEIPVYGPPDSEGCADLFRHPGILRFIPQQKFEPFRIGELTLTPLPLIHSKVTFGYAIESSTHRFAYLTDTLGLPPRTLRHLQQWQPEGVALDCTAPPTATPQTHNDWTLANRLIEEIAPQHAWLIHVGHTLDDWLMENKPVLPPSLRIARDGETYSLGSSSA
jgi:phosphoribosyl 1,2-cyclic phosphate phosphodiesterase